MTRLIRRKNEADYEQTLRDMVALFGVGNEAETNAVAVAEAIGAKKHLVTKLRTFGHKTGGLTSRFELHFDEEGAMSGRSAFWTWTHSADWMMKKATELWGFEGLDNHEIETKMPIERRGPRKKPESDPVVDQIVAQKYDDPETETQMQQQLKKVRKSDVNALVEAIRQYGNREAFIAEELKRFADMGIDIDPTAIKFTPNASYEMAQPLVSLIDKLHAANERQANTIKAKGDSAATSEREQRQKEEIAELREELRTVRNGHVNYMAQQREKSQGQDRRIKDLEEELRKVATRRLVDVAAG